MTALVSVMKKETNNNKKLKLDTTKIRVLTTKQLEDAAGGWGPTATRGCGCTNDDC